METIKNTFEKKLYKRKDLINFIIQEHEFKTYLEIGVFGGFTFKRIKVPIKMCIDPDSEFKPTYKMTSDEFFRNINKYNYLDSYDIVFIDGMHLWQYTLRDILNTMKYLNPHYIIVHDCKPYNYEQQIRKIPEDLRPWTGDVWKAWVLLRIQLYGVHMFVVDIDFGCGIITKGSQIPFKTKDIITWENFKDNQEEWLNLKSTDYFKNYVRKHAKYTRHDGHVNRK